MNQITCFLIDDDLDDREIFSIALKDISGDLQCVAASSAIEAMEKFEKEPDFVPDYIFLDLNMPLVSGHECLEEIKKKDQLRDVPVIIYSTSSNERDFCRTKKLGANYFFVKPASITKLVDKLKELFSEKELPFILS